MAPNCPACGLSRAAVDAVIADASRTRGERDDLRIELERAYNLLDGTDPLAVALRGLFGWQSGSVARIVAEVRRLQRFETTMLPRPILFRLYPEDEAKRKAKMAEARARFQAERDRG